MEEQGGFLPRAARRQIVGVEIEGAGALGVGGARLIASTGFEFLAERLVRADHQRSLGHQREEARNLRVHLLLQIVEVLRQALAALRLELRAGPHVIEELRQRALEADFLLHLHELAGDPRDFAEAQLVDLLGRHVGRRRRLDQVAVQLVAARHVHEAHALARMAEIFVLEEVAQAGDRRVELVGDRRAIFARQARAVRWRNRRREGLHRREIGRFLGLLRELRIELLDHVVNGQLGLSDARLLALLEAADRTVDVGHEVLVPLEIVLIIGERAERRSALAAGEGRIESV